MKKRLGFLVALSLLITGCAGLDSAGKARLQQAVDSLDTAVFNGTKTPETAIGSYESLYKKYPREPIAAGAYADALRRIHKPKEAGDVLRPFVLEADTNTLPNDIFMAYMRLMLDQGFFKDAEQRLKKRMTLPQPRLKGSASLAQIQNLLGVALAGQGKKEEAERAFNAALSRWDGRKGVVEKNLERLRTTK